MTLEEARQLKVGDKVITIGTCIHCIKMGSKTCKCSFVAGKVLEIDRLEYYNSSRVPSIRANQLWYEIEEVSLLSKLGKVLYE